MDIFEKFKLGLKKTASSFSSGLKEIIIKKEIDDKTLDEIEEFLIQSDVGIIASEEIKKIIAEKKIDPDKNKLDEINSILKDYIISLMSPLEKSVFFSKKTDLNAVLVSGVNGVGKTTTIGKIGKILKMNVWERGAGLTKACGTAACASAVAALKKSLVNNKVNINFSEGILNIEVDKNDNIFLTGPVSEIKKINLKL